MQLQSELDATQQAGRSAPSMSATHCGKPGQLGSNWQMSIFEAASTHSGEQLSPAALKELTEENRKLQVTP